MKLIFTIILTLFINVLCMPLWTECDYVGFIRTLFNKEARLDLLYSGKITCAEPFQYRVTPKPFYATWMYGAGDNIHRSDLCLRARGKWQELSLQLEVRRDGKITILLRGPWVLDEHGFPNCVLVDWRNLKINGETILPKRGAFSWGKGFAKQLSVKKGDILHIEAEFRRHHFSIHDFTGLKAGKIWYLITGNILVFFLIYRLLNHLRGDIRRIDAFFLAIFFPMLFIPMIGISNAVNSWRETRRYAVKPMLRDLFKEKSDYGRRYENWFNDHFGGRVALTKLHDVLRNKLSCIIRTERALFFKETGWDFLLPLISDLDCRPSFLEFIVQNIVQLNEFCQQNNIKLYVLEVPQKEIIYKELIKESYGFDEKMLTKVSQAQDFIKNEARRHHIPYIYPYRALCDATQRGDFVFFKCSHHWTDWGAFVGYNELMKEIRKDFPDMPVVSLDDYRKVSNRLERDEYARHYRFPRHLEKYFNIGDMDDLFPNQNSYPYYDNVNGDKMDCKVGKFVKDFTYPRGRRKIMLLGSSQNENFLQFLPYSTAQTKYIRVNGRGQVKTSDEYKILRLYKKDILSFKPDILILSISTDDLSRLRDLCSTK